MRIAFLHDRFPFGGGEKVTADLARGLTECYRDNEVWIIAAQFGEVRHTDKIHYERLPDGAKLKYPSGMSALIGLLRDKAVDVLIMPIDPPDGLLDAVRRELPECKLIYILHSVPMWQVENKRQQGLVKNLRESLLGTYTRRYRRRYVEIYSKVDAFVTLCGQYKRDVELIVGADRCNSKVYAVYNPVDVGHYLPYRSVRKEKEVLYVGRLSYADKRVDRLIRIWSSIEPLHPDWVLKIVGEGPEKNKLCQLASKLGLNNVKFVGYSADPREHYSTASILCLTSSFEGWGMVLAESASAGVVPIAFECSAGTSQLLDLVGGIKVAPFDEGEYERKLVELMGHYPEIENGSSVNDLLTQFSPETIAGEWHIILTALK